MQTNDIQNGNRSFRPIGYAWAAIAVTFWVTAVVAIIVAVEASK